MIQIDSLVAGEVLRNDCELVSCRFQIKDMLVMILAQNFYVRTFMLADSTGNTDFKCHHDLMKYDFLPHSTG